MNGHVAIASRNLRGKTGVSAIVLEQVSHLRSSGHRIDVIGEKLDEKMIRAAGGNPVRLRRLPGPRYTARRFFSHRFDRLARQHRYDLVIGNSELLHQDVLFLHNLSHMEHETVPGSNSAGLQSKMRFDELLFQSGSYQVCIANSELMKHELTQRYSMDPGIIRVIHPGFNPEQFSTGKQAIQRHAAREELCADEDLLIGFITSGHFAKRGADLMIETLELLEPHLQQRIKVLAIGSAKNTAALQSSFIAHDLPIEVVQRDKTDDLAPYYHAIDLLFYPARMEEFGLVVVEAAACGTPVLTSAATGAAEVLRSSANDLAPRPTPPEFAPRLTRLLLNKDARATLAAQQNSAVAKADWQHYFEKVFAVYAELGLQSD